MKRGQAVMRRGATMVLRRKVGWRDKAGGGTSARHTGFFFFAFYSGQQTDLPSEDFTIVQIIPENKCYNRYSVSQIRLFDEGFKRRSCSP